MKTNILELAFSTKQRLERFFTEVYFARNYGEPMTEDGIFTNLELWAYSEYFAGGPFYAPWRAHTGENPYGIECYTFPLFGNRLYQVVDYDQIYTICRITDDDEE